MKRLLSIVAILLLLVVLAGCIPDGWLPNTGNTPSQGTTPGEGTKPSETEPDDNFENYGLPVIKIYLSELTIKEDGLYTSMKEVGAYLYLYHRLPKNFVTKSNFNSKNYTSSNKLSTGGDTFYNREGLLPSGKSYRECDIDYHGGSRGQLRIVYSVTDWTIFYTSNHSSSFSNLRIFE